MENERLLVLGDGVIDWEPLLRRMIEGREVTATAFIESLAEVIVSLADRTPGVPVILTGGVFQNKTLMERVLPRLEGRTLLLPRRLPPNDGAIALGQVWQGLNGFDA